MRHLYLLIAVCAGIAVAACGSDSPVEPPSSGAVLFSGSVASGITATAVSPSEIDLSWPSSPSATGYQIVRSDNGATGNYSLIASPAANVGRYADAGLAGSTLHCYEVRSFKTAGKNTTYSAYSAAACATTLAPPINTPSSVDAVPMRSDYLLDLSRSWVHVTWKDNSANEDGFRVERASAAAGPWTQETTTAANATSWDLYAPREQQVCVRVIAFSAAGMSSPTSPDCTTPPASPTNLLAKATDGQSIALTWTDNSATEDGYEVSRLGPSGGWTDIATLPANAVSYRDIGVTIDVTYAYRVLALKDGGFSQYSNASVAVIPTGPPTAPFAASASYYAERGYYGDGWLYFLLNWADASNNEEGFRIEVSADGTSGWQEYTTVVANTTSFYDQFNLLYEYLPIAECFRLVAFNSAGESAPSNVTCTEWDNPPTNVTATAVDQQSIDLTWTDNGRFENGYVVYRSTAVDGMYDVVAETPPNATSYPDTGLVSGQEYWYFVASDFGGASSQDPFNYSAFVSATTLSATVSAALSMQSSRKVITRRLIPVRIIGRPTLEDLRARYRAAQPSTAIGGAGVTPIRVKGAVRKKPRIR